MPKFSTPAGSTQRYIPALDRSAPDSIPGTKKVYADRAAFLQGVADERACIAMGLPVWFDGIDLQVMSEPLGAKRLWSLSTSAGSPAANADASHGRTAVIGAFVKVLSSDSSRILSTNGAPASGLGDNGDMAWDQVAGIVYEKASGAWSILVSMYGSGGSSPVAPGAVQNLAAGTATTNSQPLSWQAPATGTGPFTYQVGYRLGTSTGAYTNFGSPVSGLSANVTGLSAGTAYDYQVTAINAAGSGPAATINDAPTASAATVPGAPTGATATAGDGTVSVAFTAPSSNGGASITGYRVTLSTGQTATGASSPISVAAPNGTPVTATVAAQNSVGYGAESAASNSVTPSASATVPGAPTIGGATAGDNSVSVAFTAPASDGGSAILDYTVTLSTGQTGTGAASPIVVSAPAGTPVTATVRARNAIGQGPASAASNSATPTGVAKVPLNARTLTNVTSLGDNSFVASGSAAAGQAGIIGTGMFIPANSEGWVEAEFETAGSSYTFAFGTGSSDTAALNTNERIAQITATGGTNWQSTTSTATATGAAALTRAAGTRTRFGRGTDGLFKIQRSADSGQNWSTDYTWPTALTSKVYLRVHLTHSTSVTPNAREIIHPLTIGMTQE